MPDSCSQFSTEDFKEILNVKLLKLLNDIYRTRLSDKAYNIIFERLEEVKDFNDYEAVLKQFKECNPRKNGKTDALSFGTKLLHTYNPEENPIFDSIIRRNLGIKEQLDIDLCVKFKNAMNRFAEEHKEYFILCENSARVKDEFKNSLLNTHFPKMKMLDMAIYKKPTKS